MMVQVDLTSKEKKKMKELKSVYTEMSELTMRYQKKVAEFWYSFQKRMGYGNFQMNVRDGVVFDLGPYIEKISKEKTKINKKPKL